MFIKECAKYLYDKYGQEISNLNILLPSRRATLFFNMELSKLINDTPVWQPKFLSPDKIFTSLSGIQQAERLKLLVVLYRVYSNYHKEPFDKFYYWGDMLLSDFDTIDNYMIDAEKLYTNSSDLREIEERFDYLPDEDIEEINRFWQHFKESRNSDEKNYFFNIWKTLYPIYKEFKATLLSENIGYSGMIYRTVAEKIIAKEKIIDSNTKFAIIGFNALSTTERVLFDALKEYCSADFLWDNDNSYINNKTNEAGLFIRANIKRYGEANKTVYRDNYLNSKEITIVNSPSSSIECKYVWEFLEQCNSKAKVNGKILGAETAIILTDESLLLPVLYSIPPFIEHFNVTAGYELRLTDAYSLCEMIISLQTNCRTDSGIEFYYKDVESIISHPLIRINMNENEKQYIDTLRKENKIYYTAKSIQRGDYLTKLFSHVKGWSPICDYLLFILNTTLSQLTSLQGTETKEAIFRTYNTINSLKDIVNSIGIELSDNIFLSVLRKHLQGERISFEGEPLVGIQIMGILESRNLDFENVLLLSVGEDNFPSKSMGSSFIPSNLRHGYGLPTINYHQAMYSYYFYRLLQRASRVDISYVSMGDEMGNGEPSRYIYQLIYDKEHTIKRLNLTLDITTSDTGTNTELKEGATKEYIEMVRCGKRTLSASSLSNYIQCPMRFYYSNIAALRDDEEEREIEIGAIEMGDAMHHSLQTIYSSVKNIPHSELIEKLKALTEQDIENEVTIQLAKITTLKPEEFDTIIKNNRKFIVSYISTIINYDLNRNDDFTVIGVEEKIVGEVQIDGVIVKFTGQVDRIDRTESGSIKIIDYKSGVVKDCKSIYSLFDTEKGEHNKPVMQSLLYSLFYSKQKNVDVIPTLYYVRSMNKKGFSPIIDIKTIGEIHHYAQVKDEYEAELKEKLKELLDLEKPLYKCNEKKMCKFCDYQELCNI